ncbi:uncharacterized protein LOC122500087 [Leptopilina heterotoma]|uniref:uncharacterized protein LOC122500087 n=1 Tax=Leptopilina heterotoma TaxID=63436 RepID=UPI001CA81DFD|nr:uncharacterized protein LOC122500087 [Leptopilina heterotoma]
MLTNNLQIDQELWSIYAWWTSILVLKMMYLTWATGRLRVEHKVFHSEEDKMWAEGPVTLCCSGGGHPAVDRIRAVHQRDLKILIPYIIFAPLWLIISPCNFITQLLLRIVPLSNILYTFIYLNTTQIFGSNCCKILSYLEHFTVLTAITRLTRCMDM